MSGCTSPIAVELAQCLVKKEEIVDAQILGAFEKVSKVAQERFDLVYADTSLLEQSQINWKRYVDAHCRLIGALQGMGCISKYLKFNVASNQKLIASDSWGTFLLVVDRPDRTHLMI